MAVSISPTCILQPSWSSSVNCSSADSTSDFSPQDGKERRQLYFHCGCSSCAVLEGQVRPANFQSKSHFPAQSPAHNSTGCWLFSWRVGFYLLVFCFFWFGSWYSWLCSHESWSRDLRGRLLLQFSSGGRLVLHSASQTQHLLPPRHLPRRLFLFFRSLLQPCSELADSSIIQLGLNKTPRCIWCWDWKIAKLLVQ